MPLTFNLNFPDEAKAFVYVKDGTKEATYSQSFTYNIETNSK